MQARWLMTERHAPVAGASRGDHGQWASLNLGEHVGDDPAAVAHNRALLAGHLQGLGGTSVRYLRQVHGSTVVRLGRDAMAPRSEPPEADAAWSTRPGVVCTVMVADCLPVLLSAHDAQGQAVGVAAAHAGWRGMAGGVLSEAVAALTQGTGTAAQQVWAWLGPCIGPQAFEVGPEVREAFIRAHGSQAASAFQALGSKFMADLAALARSQLQQLGVTPGQIQGNDSSASWCTVNNPSRFFSHRRDAGRLGSSGRMAACIWLDVRG